MMRSACAASLASLLCAPFVAVDAQGIAGFVRDTLGQPLVGATVTVLPGDATARTDEAGRFVLPLVAPGDYRVTARRVGYLPGETAVTVVRSVRARVEIRLRRRAPTLDTVRSRVSQNSCNNRTLLGFECRRQAGVGYFRNAEELAALKPQHLHDLFRDLPGIRMGTGRDQNGLPEFLPTVRPSRCLKTLVNGRPLFGTRWWSARDVIGIEYYDEWRKIPLDYRQIADTGSCDLIVYWLNTAFVDEP
jgi:hypothetical protein